MRVHPDQRAIERVPRRSTPSLLLAIAVAVLVVSGTVVWGYVRSLSPDPYEAFRRGCLVDTGSALVTLDKVTRPHYVGSAITQFTIGCRTPSGIIASRTTTNHL